MAARIARTSLSQCVHIGRKLQIPRPFSTCQTLLVRRARPKLDAEESEETNDDDFYGITSDRGVVTVGDPLLDAHDRLEKFSHLTRSRNAKISDEKVISANFGTIRYDSDNAPRYHGQFEDERLLDEFFLDSYGPVAVPGSERAKARQRKNNTVTSESVSVDDGEPVFDKLQNGEATLSGSSAEREQAPSYEDSRKKTRTLKPAKITRKIASNCATEESEEVREAQRYTGTQGVKFQLEVAAMEPTENNDDHRKRPQGTQKGVVQGDTPKKGRAGVRTFSGQEQQGKLDKVLDAVASTKEEQDIVDPPRRRQKPPKKSEEAANSQPDLVIARTQIREDSFLFAQSKTRATVPHGAESQETGDDRKNKIAEGRLVGNQEHERPDDPEGAKSAFDFLRRQSPISDTKLDSKGFRILKSEIRPDLSCLLKTEVVKLLTQRVLFDDHDILAIDKPYGMICHGPSRDTSEAHILTFLLPELSSALYPGKDVKLYTVHRLDRDVTGVQLLAKTQRMADMLNSLFQRHEVSKTYLAITSGVPDHSEGIVDMPLAEGSVDGARRMVLSPKLDPDFQRLVPRFGKTFEAVTHYKVLASRGHAAFVELRPSTGVKHQLRVHLGLGLRCPILGDHKYSHLRRLAPQKLAGDVLDALGVRQTKVRDVPLHLHARAIVVPEVLDGRNLTVAAQVPYHFAKNLRRLKLNRTL